MIQRDVSSSSSALLHREPTAETAVSAGGSDESRDVLTMSHFGKLGGFGNQVLQYGFLQYAAQLGGVKEENVQCPEWIGNALFGNPLNPPTVTLPPCFELVGGVRSVFSDCPEALTLAEKKAGGEGVGVFCDPSEVLLSGRGLRGVDVFGFFQLHTETVRPFKEQWRKLFQPNPKLQSKMETALRTVVSEEETLVVLQLRRGDYRTFSAASFALVTPAEWWLEWLESVWGQLERPRLAICSDDLDAVLPVFRKFAPLSGGDLGLSAEDFVEAVPELEGKAKGVAGFYTDFWLMSQADVLGISNSTFGFTAAMLNEKAGRFVRPTWDLAVPSLPFLDLSLPSSSNEQAQQQQQQQQQNSGPRAKLAAEAVERRFCTFDPWDAEPLLHIDPSRQSAFKSVTQDVWSAWVTCGWVCALWSLFCRFVLLPLGMGVIFPLKCAYDLEGVRGVGRCVWRRRFFLRVPKFERRRLVDSKRGGNGEGEAECGFQERAADDVPARLKGAREREGKGRIEVQVE